MSTRSGAGLSDEPWHWTLLEAANAIAAGQAVPSASVFERGSLRLKIYAPKGEDRQELHDQDEVYVVAKGSGQFFNGGRRHSFQPGDAIFVPAGVEHRFEDFTDDLLVWVMFYGPKGGEIPY